MSVKARKFRESERDGWELEDVEVSTSRDQFVDLSWREVASLHRQLGKLLEKRGRK